MTGSEPRSTAASEASVADDKAESSEASSKKLGEDTSEPQERKPGLWAGLKNALNPFARMRRKASGTLRANLEDELARKDVGADAAFTASERELLTNILQLRELRVDDVMIPRADIQAVDDTASIGLVMEKFQESGHSRMPVYHDNLDDPRGMVHIKDLMAYFAEQAGYKSFKGRKQDKSTSDSAGENGDKDTPDLARVNLDTPLSQTGLIRPLHFVPPSMSSSELMKQMQVTRVQMALVIDEYGGTDGLVSLEDIVETVVGDIEDEHDKDEEAMVSQVADGVWVADPRVDIEDLQEELGTDFSVGEHAEEVDTLGGMLFTLLDRVPVRGELIADKRLPGYEFEVLDADPRRIKRLRIYRRRFDQRAGSARLRTKRTEAAAE
ncbi:HlyC/CorC family transporter [Rhodobacteraceae bacterium RKSG542]|uniref:hemolysin family protein n=1 Tax=Pseudovibrio flavus TaxID=2529854 RepID=UPI0012BC0535|nr:hemolysin family protein [Pseudovibrio flavus]MTI17899.1 HlyC/CorC family transporter [Pseudovibrio flavus]